ncbi:MAG: NAD(P)/FAD-dependent oxidoreductase [Candidatus Sericytochromatia bacterium]
MWDLIVVGAGAAGLFCAFNAGKRGKRVLVIEHQPKPGRKILISGGGRCNFTNLYAGPENYISQNPHFCKSALARYTPGDFIELVEAHGIPYHEKKLGQLFCDRSAQDILTLLLDECASAGVKLYSGLRVQRISKGESEFSLETPDQTFQSRALVLATGGLSIPKMGASDFGYRMAKHFGHSLVDPQPGLVPLTFAKSQQSLADLRGLSLDSEVSFGAARFRENTLFAHFGLSGPAILQISSFWQAGQNLRLNFLPELNLAETLWTWQREKRQALVTTLLDEFLPKRFVRAWQERYFPAKPPTQLNQADIEQLCEVFQAWSFVPAGTAGYAKAEVTTGGIDTAEVSSKTMESRHVKGLYLIGELLDVTGWLGGYNFQWAWASGYAASQAI